MMRIAGRHYDSESAKAIRTNENGEIIVARAKTESVLLFDQVELTSTSRIYSEDVDLSGAKDITIYVMNTYNVPVFLAIQMRPDGVNRHTAFIKTLDMEDFVTEIPSRFRFTGMNIITEDQIPALKASLNRIRIGVSVNDVPDTGNLNVLLSFKRGG